MALPVKASDEDVQRELMREATDAARPYYSFAAEVAAAVKNNPEKLLHDAMEVPLKDAPAYVHMMKAFTEAQIKSSARQAEDKKFLSIHIEKAVILPPQKQIDEANVVDVIVRDE